MLGNYLQQTLSADVIFSDAFFSWRFKGNAGAGLSLVPWLCNVKVP